MADDQFSNFRPRYAPPMSDKPMVDDMNQRAGSNLLGAGAYGLMSAGAAFPAFTMSAWLARALAASSGLAARGYLSKAGQAHEASNMLANTGMPGRPVPDEQNALLKMYRIKQLYGED